MSKQTRGGFRPGSGKKPGKQFINKTILISPADKEAIETKYGILFQQMVRDWIKSIL